MITGTSSSPILLAARIFILVSAIVYSVWGHCFNDCSGNGECNRYGLCDCWGDYEGWDCSFRRCRSGSAWSDLAVGRDDAHNDAVCSNMGHCVRETGSCICHDGFEGRACDRMSCPNGCSGHGECISMAEAAATDDGYRLTRVTSYGEWDAQMIYGCICDLGYEGYDCSRRHCPTSDSASTSGQRDESVILYCRCGIDCASTFRLRFKGQYATIIPSMDEDKLAAKLMALPTVKSDADEYKFSPIVVKFSGGESSVCSTGGTKTTVTFARDPGDLPPVYIKFNKLTSSDGADVHITTMVTLSCTCNGECGGHFQFIGNGDEATKKLPFNAGKELIQAGLLGLSDLSAANITVDILGGGSASCEYFNTVNTSISIDLEYGNYPLQVVASMYDRGQRGGEMTLTTNDGNKEQEYCAGHGTCNFETGECICDENYGYDQDYGSCGQYIVSHSHWAGRQMCPGFVLRPTFDILPEDANDWQLYFSDGGINFGDNYTMNRIFYSTVFSPGFYWFNQEEGGTDDRILFTNAIDTTTDISNAFALDMTYRVLYYGQGNKVLRVTLPSDLKAEEVAAAGNALSGSPVEVFVVLPEDEAAGYLETDLRPEERYLYWTVPGSPNIPDGKVHRKKLSNSSDATLYEDLTDSIRSGMVAAGLDLMEPLGIALDLRDEKMYFTDAQIQGNTGGEDGIIIRCELDGSRAQVVVDHSLYDPRALVMDVRGGVMYLTDTHIPSLIRVETSNIIGQEGSSQISTILRGVTQPQHGRLTEETYYQPLLSPQGLQFDTRVQGLTTLFMSDYGTGFIYTVATDGKSAETFLSMGRPKGFIFDLGEGYPTYTLYSDCHGHGVCSGPPHFTCSCDEGWEGNCAQKSCPKGPAWFDEAATDGSAHAYAECSNLGHCNRDTGVCTCHEGFTGDACQRMKCPNDCSGNGKCLSMRQLGLMAVDDDLNPSPATYGSVDGNPSTWDADAVHGCFCDWMGYQGRGPSYTNLSDWTGYDCSRKTCPTGDDIKRTTAEVADFERQDVFCTLKAGSERENSSFSLAFRQGTTDLMSGNISLVDLEEALESLVTIGDVEVTVRGDTGSSTLNFCNSSNGEPASVTFKTELGDLPLLSAASSNGVKIDVVEATRGTKLDAECSRHGVCDYTEGECMCFKGWGSSDGNGAIGHRRDCGWYKGARKSS